ncbi:heavy-metal-associated domain-containing protein [Novosphingobium sp. JCM 18896]|uniref:heavy-metal-associated domain-containing protein n=1 Tax=Novosphingobium sp. JCM 18896 TaxID=2989731 RepID=UPI002222CC6A|nr:heavy-metal-associated domain-containing protein [Novosphingobium sp. JCM 18896]MCW1427982.1 heavy-metal-associated domain-containing protein [Novosphingobium sp. JCM 18896]
MHHLTFPQRLATFRPGPAGQLVIGLATALALALAVTGSGRLTAQVEGERGIAPLATTTDIQVGGIEVNTTGKTAEEAREAGWNEAQRKAWEQIGGAKLSDGQIDALVSAVVIEREQIGPHRYVARLGVVFDRAKAGGLIAAGEGGVERSRSAPLLVLPILESGGVGQVFEVRGLWQRAWANFQTGASPIDYVRPVGAGGESLLLTAGQASRRSRLWWRGILDQFNASDVLIPVARLERQWPGGPVKGTFTARYGPDNTYLDSFTLTAPDERGVPKMLNQALVRIDQIYAGALYQGVLRPDATLVTDQSAFYAALAALHAAAAQAAPLDDGAPVVVTPGATPSATPTAATKISTFTVQFASPDAGAVDTALASVRSSAGVQGAATSSIAIGGTSVMRVTSGGSLDELAAALRARGWQVSVGNNALSIKR